MPDANMWCTGVGISIAWELILFPHSAPAELESVGRFPGIYVLTSFPGDFYASKGNQHWYVCSSRSDYLGDGIDLQFN